MAQQTKGTGPSKASSTVATPVRKTRATKTKGTPKPSKNIPGDTLLHGANRTLRYYKPTEVELDRLGELSRDESTARAYFGFCLGLVANVLLGALFATGLSDSQKGIAFGIGIIAALAAFKFYGDAERKRRDGRTALEKLKRDHDFSVSI